MARRSSKLFTWLLVLLLPAGLIGVLFVGPFSLLSKLLILGSPYRKLLPYIIAQARHETADFTSAVYNREHNLFGMKHPTKRPSFGTKGNPAPEGGNYQHYAFNVVSVMDYLRYLKYVNFPTTVTSSADFAKKLQDKSYYGTTPGELAIYTNGINRFLS